MTTFHLHLTQPVRTIAVLKAGRRIPVPLRIETIPSSPADPPPVSLAELAVRREALQTEQRLALTLERLADQLPEVVSQLTGRLAEFKQAAWQLARLATRTLCLNDNETREARLEALIEAGLQKFPPGQKLQIRVNREQLAQIEARLAHSTLRPEVAWFGDPAVPPGEVQFDHPLFSLATNSERQLHEIESAMQEAMADAFS